MDTDPRFQFGHYELDPGTFKLLKSGETVALEPKGIDLLRLLLERAPRVVEKQEIFSIVWKDVAVTDNALTRLITHIRKVLEDDPKMPRYIETSRREAIGSWLRSRASMAASIGTTTSRGRCRSPTSAQRSRLTTATIPTVVRGDRRSRCAVDGCADWLATGQTAGCRAMVDRAGIPDVSSSPRSKPSSSRRATATTDFCRLRPMEKALPSAPTVREHSRSTSRAPRRVRRRRH